jgi:hypothetical protein
MAAQNNAVDALAATVSLLSVLYKERQAFDIVFLCLFRLSQS